jgi:hypothetical protein
VQPAALQLLAYGDHHQQQQQQQQQQQGTPWEQGAAQQVEHDSTHPGTALLLSSVTEATFVMQQVLDTDSSALWRSLWGAMPALQCLNLKWPLRMDLLPQLPPMAAFTGLTSLRLIGKSDLYSELQHADLQVLLKLLQGASHLEELGLLLDVRGGVAAAGAGGSRGGGGIPDGSSVGTGSSGNSSVWDYGYNIDSGDCISRDSLLLCLQKTLPSLRRLLTQSHEVDLVRAKGFWRWE